MRMNIKAGAVWVSGLGFDKGAKMIGYLRMILFVLAVSFLTAGDVWAAEGGRDPSANYAIAVLMGLAAIGGTFGQSRAIVSALESMGRNPAAGGKIQTAMLIGLAFIESLVIIGFVVVFVKL